MCQQKSLIYTKKKKPLVVDCGHCIECQQAKANRYTNLIRNNSITNGKYINLFVTFTYDNKFLPCISKSQLREQVGFLYGVNDVQLDVYRHCQIRKVKTGFASWSERVKLCSSIDTVTFNNVSFEDIEKLRGYNKPVLNNSSKKYHPHDDLVGIVYLPDIQNFFKRLKISYERKYNRRLVISYFWVSEYGPSTLRPHFHAIIRILAQEKDIVAKLIRENWKFCNWSAPEAYKNIQIAKDCASYVASYVNQHNYLPALYFEKAISPRCSHTHYYGLANKEFSLPKILEAFDKRDLHYTVRYKTSSATYERLLLIPSYVISYYFPKFKGCSDLSSDELRSIYFNPERLRFYARRLGYTSRFDKVDFLEFSDKFFFDNCRSCDRFGKFIGNYLLDDVFNCSIQKFLPGFSDTFIDLSSEFSKHNDFIINLHKLYAARFRFIHDYLFYFGNYSNILYKYADIASQIWTVRASNLLIDSYKCYDEDERYQFSVYDSSLIAKCNDFPENLAKSLLLKTKFFKYDKSKKVKNEYLCSKCVNF